MKMFMEFLDLKLRPEEFEKIGKVLASLKNRLGAESVCLISRNGQEIARAGRLGSIDRDALSSLAASCLAATYGLAKLLGEEEFERIYQKGERRSILINRAGENALLLLVFRLDGSQEIDLKGLRQGALILEDVLTSVYRRALEQPKTQAHTR